MTTPERIAANHEVARDIKKQLERVARKALVTQSYGELRHIIDALQHNAEYLESCSEDYEQLTEAARPEAALPAGGVQ